MSNEPAPLRVRGASCYATTFQIQAAFYSVTELKEQRQPRKRVQIYCDGSSLGNGQVGSRAAAAAIGLESLREPCDVEVFTDSRYVVETMCGRFRKKTNPDWWKRLERAAAQHHVAWQWTRGHVGHPLQEAADTTARRIAAAQRVEEAILRDTVDLIGTTEG